MSKYSLVASYYDVYKKTYQNQVTVVLENIDLSTMQAIDFFTSSNKKSEILEKIETEMNVKGINHLAIKYKKNKDAEPEYYRIIENHPQFASIFKNLNTKTYKLPNYQKRTATVIDKQNPFYLQELQKLIQILESRNIEAFVENYPYHDKNNIDLYFLVKRYMNSFYEDVYLKQEDFEMIKSEFSRYITFRRWIIGQEKKSLPKRPMRAPQQIQGALKLNSNRKTIQEHEEDFLREYQKKNGESWEETQTRQYNSQYEEHLTPEELEMMYGEVEEIPDSPKIRRR